MLAPPPEAQILHTSISPPLSSSRTSRSRYTMPPDLMQNFRPENIPTAISAFQPDGEVPVLNELHLEGGQCCIFKADFSDGESWSVRIPIHVQSDSQDVIINVLQAERDVLQEINRKGFRWAPKYLGSSFTFQNLVGFPFLALSWIEGSPLSWSPVDPPRPLRDKVLGQIAEIQMSLIECTKENSVFTRPPCVNAY